MPGIEDNMDDGIALLGNSRTDVYCPENIMAETVSLLFCVPLLPYSAKDAVDFGRPRSRQTCMRALVILIPIRPCHLESNIPQLKAEDRDRMHGIPALPRFDLRLMADAVVAGLDRPPRP
ncbi:hypothetical protein POX_d05323 [Penicillium oxalicum]|uniref:hypothetical protein n=1 Tax=Penicillium oxalicum TaxID=69781 RepID=UPI0020B7EB67|nr:hypothetical protein POX_d05323 [Penicillium oxalicum]KAI2789825.1 hypothetical protein POX_d05323 [Penicillium oxalicum]